MKTSNNWVPWVFIGLIVAALLMMPLASSAVFLLGVVLGVLLLGSILGSELEQLRATNEKINQMGGAIAEAVYVDGDGQRIDFHMMKPKGLVESDLATGGALVRSMEGSVHWRESPAPMPLDKTMFADGKLPPDGSAVYVGGDGKVYNTVDAEHMTDTVPRYLNLSLDKDDGDQDG